MDGVGAKRLVIDSGYIIGPWPNQISGKTSDFPIPPEFALAHCTGKPNHLPEFTPKHPSRSGIPEGKERLDLGSVVLCE